MKKLLMFLMVAIPILVVLIVKLTATVAVGDVFISVESISLDRTKISAMVGESADLNFNIYPKLATNKEVIWASSNEASAIVDKNGHVQFVGIGSGYISAVTKDGNKRSQCSFYVWDTKVHQVTLTAPQNYVHLGDTLQLTATVLPNEALIKDVKFASSDEGVATVDTNGLVSGLSEGNVTITVTTVDGNYSDFVDLSVIKPVTSLVVEKSEIITSSKSVQIEYWIEPFDATNKNCLFKVDNEDIAQVNHLGLVTFNKAGEVNVTITTVDGNFEKTIKIIYTGGYAYDLLLETSTINMEIGDAPVHIDYHTLPETLYETAVEFSSYDENIAYVDYAGYLHAVKGGNTVISVKVKTSAEEYIKKELYVNIESPAKDIVIEDVLTAEKTVLLKPKSSPDDSTNTNFFYHIEEPSLASVSEDGLVIFKSQSPCTVTVTIYANQDFSDVFKKVKVTYTAGKVGVFELLDKNITLMFGQTKTLNYKVLPNSATIKPLTISVEENHPIVAGANVVEILENGTIRATSGGTAKLKVIFVLYDETIVEDFCTVTVLREPEDIKINLDLQFYKSQYVTSQRVIPLLGEVLPADAQSKELVWSVSDTNIAFIRDNLLIFNQVGFVTLTASIGEISNSVEVYYAGSNPVFANAVAVVNGKRVPVPEKIMVGDSFDIEISEIIPNYAVNPSISVQATNQKTVNSTGKVLEIEGGTVRGIAGGTATLVVYVSNSIRLNYQITVERKPESISVLQANTRVTTDVVNLVSEVLPYDTTNQGVRYVLLETDIAQIDGETLTFKKNGTVNITAICEGDESVWCKFFIEKIEKNMLHISPEETSKTVSKGDLIVFDTTSVYNLKIKSSTPTVLGETVVAVEDNYLRAVSAGRATVVISTAEREYEVEIIVNQLVEDIVLQTSADFYNEEYVIGKNVLDLNFEIYPNYAANKEVSVTIYRSISADGEAAQIAFISGKQIVFAREGTVYLQISSNDGNCTKIIKINYTGGEAIDAQLNIGSLLVMNIGDKVTIGVSKWIPYDVTSTRISMSEVNSSGKKVVEINEKTRTIVAVASGETKLIVKLSDNIVKEVQIICVKKIADLQVEDVLIASNTYVLAAKVTPDDATNKLLEFSLEPTDIARLEGDILRFVKAGTAKVTVRTTDGSNIEKTFNVTCTMGHIGKIVLNEQKITLKKGETLKLEAAKYPLDATENSLQFKILSQSAYDGLSQVITLAADGQITALCRGKVVVRVFAFDYFGNEVFADCEITVQSPLEAIDIKFETALDKYQNAYITSKNELAFSVVYQPEDAEVQEFTYSISDANVARIEGQKIIFLKKGGRVTITFKCHDETNVERTISYTFQYYGEDLVEAALDKTEIPNNVINLKAGDSFKFSLVKALPSDNQNVEFIVKNADEIRIDKDKQVAKFENGVLYALNGGTYTFTLYANNFNLGKFTLIVTRDATEVIVENGEQVFVSVPYHTIVAHVLETDSQQQTLGYKTNSQNVSLSTNGTVTFKQFGECEVTVYVIDNPNIFKIVKIKYTNQLQAIEFKQTREKLFVTDGIDLYLQASPANSEAFEYTMEIDNANIAKLSKENGVYHLTALKGGEVKVTAKVVGKNISVSKTFTIYEKIRDIKLQFNAGSDNQGGGYRVFGTSFVNGDTVINNFSINVEVNATGPWNNLLQWSSSDESVAQVDQNGVVTVLKAGKTTITVQQQPPYEDANIAFDSYEFKFVDGINVNNFEQFKVAHAELTTQNTGREQNLAALVLHGDVKFDSTFGIVVFNYNVYGNSYMLDHSNVISDWARFYISRNNVVLDNVTLRGVNITSGVELKGKGNALMIENCSGVVLYNTKIENAETAVRIQSSQVAIAGCVFKNCLQAGIKLARSETVVSHLYIKDSVFTTSFCGIVFVMDAYNNPEQSTIKLGGDVRFYNWSTLDQIEEGLDIETILKGGGVPFADGISGEIYSQLEKILKEDKSVQDFAYTPAGSKTTYYNFAIMQMTADVSKLIPKIFAGVGTIDRTALISKCNYTDISLSKALYLGASIPVTCNVMSLRAQGAFIKPKEDYTKDVTLKITQPFVELGNSYFETATSF